MPPANFAKNEFIILQGPIINSGPGASRQVEGIVKNGPLFEKNVHYVTVRVQNSIKLNMTFGKQIGDTYIGVPLPVGGIEGAKIQKINTNFYTCPRQKLKF